MTPLFTLIMAAYAVTVSNNHAALVGIGLIWPESVLLPSHLPTRSYVTFWSAGQRATDCSPSAMSFDENAECSCSKGDVGRTCYPPGVTEGLLCSGRGTCVCGQCVCNPNTDPEFPTKMVMGEYCEYDNFSCDGPKCNEGPYSLANPTLVEKSVKTADVDIPAS